MALRFFLVFLGLGLPPSPDLGDALAPEKSHPLLVSFYLDFEEPYVGLQPSDLLLFAWLPFQLCHLCLLLGNHG